MIGTKSSLKKAQIKSQKLATPRDSLLHVLKLNIMIIGRKLRIMLEKFEDDLEHPKAIKTLRDAMTS